MSHIAIAVVDLLQELTDTDTLHESEEGAEVLIDSLVSPAALLCPRSVSEHLVSSRTFGPCHLLPPPPAPTRTLGVYRVLVCGVHSCTTFSGEVVVIGKGVRMAERLGNRAIYIRRLPVRFPAVRNEIVSLGNALHPTCLGGMSLYFQSLWIRASAKCKW